MIPEGTLYLVTFHWRFADFPTQDEKTQLTRFLCNQGKVELYRNSTYYHHNPALLTVMIQKAIQNFDWLNNKNVCYLEMLRVTDHFNMSEILPKEKK